MSDDDLGAIVAFINQLPPVDREWPSPSVKLGGRLMMVATNDALLPAELIDHHDARSTPTAPAPTAEYGEHLASSTGCRSCHRADLSGGAGPPPGAANITRAGAIKNWSEADFVRAIRTGRRPNGTEISPSMPRDFSHLTDLELHALWLYLQSVPPRPETIAAR